MIVRVPPIKSQGIKTKLVPLIREMIVWDRSGTWIEPFAGTAVVGLNVDPPKALFADTNPHTIGFYQALQRGEFTPTDVRDYLITEGEELRRAGDKHYYLVRERFNRLGNPLDFLFLSRACFNGVMRFNRKGGFNVPFCRKPDRYAKPLVTKITNQVKSMLAGIQRNNWEFRVQDYTQSIRDAGANDFIYVDPPYVGRHVDYFDSWNEDQERTLHAELIGSPANFMLSTWEENRHRRNPFIDSLWGGLPRVTQDHFYHVGAKEGNRNAMREALIMNYSPLASVTHRTAKLIPTHLELLSLEPI